MPTQSLATASFPYFYFVIVPLVVLIIFFVLVILFFLWYFRKFYQNKIAISLGIIILILPTIILGVMLFLITSEKTRLVEVTGVKCSKISIFPIEIFPGVVKVKDLTTGKNFNLLMPMSDWEEGETVLLDDLARPYDTWYNSYFCSQDEIYEKEIKGRPLWVTTNGYGRIIEWMKYKAPASDLTTAECASYQEKFDEYIEKFNLPFDNPDSLCFGLNLSSDFSKLTPKWAIGMLLGIDMNFKGMSKEGKIMVPPSSEIMSEYYFGSYYKIDMNNLCRYSFMLADSRYPSDIISTFIEPEEVNCQ